MFTPRLLCVSLNQVCEDARPMWVSWMTTRGLHRTIERDARSASDSIRCLLCECVVILEEAAFMSPDMFYQVVVPLIGVAVLHPPRAPCIAVDRYRPSGSHVTSLLSRESFQNTALLAITTPRAKTSDSTRCNTHESTDVDAGGLTVCLCLYVLCVVHAEDGAHSCRQRALRAQWLWLTVLFCCVFR